MQLKISNVLILFALVSNVFIGPVLSQWVEIDIGLRRAIGSALPIAEQFGARMTTMLRAYSWTNMQEPETNYYWVSFRAVTLGGQLLRCQGGTFWRFHPTFTRTVYYPRCDPVLPRY